MWVYRTWVCIHQPDQLKLQDLWHTSSTSPTMQDSLLSTKLVHTHLANLRRDNQAKLIWVTFYILKSSIHHWTISHTSTNGKYFWTSGIEFADVFYIFIFLLLFTLDIVKAVPSYFWYQFNLLQLGCHVCMAKWGTDVGQVVSKIDRTVIDICREHVYKQSWSWWNHWIHFSWICRWSPCYACLLHFCHLLLLP